MLPTPRRSYTAAMKCDAGKKCHQTPPGPATAGERRSNAELTSVNATYNGSSHSAALANATEMFLKFARV